MASLTAVFVCYVCRHVFPLSLKHHCQKECSPLTGLHQDFCVNCKVSSLDLWASQMEEKKDDCENRAE